MDTLKTLTFFTFISLAFSAYALDEYRSIDGSGNNVAAPEWGKAEEQLLRLDPLQSFYADGLNVPAGGSRPSARLISNIIFNQTTSIPNSEGFSDFFWLWGQFVDHDIDLTLTGSDPLHISVPTGDTFFDPLATGTQIIPMARSIFDPFTGVGGIQREQINTITAFIDASTVYGSDQTRNNFIRGKGGKLVLSQGDLLPFNDGTIANAGGPGTNFFVAGDLRANENLSLTALHTVFAREHNRLVDELSHHNPKLSDEALYQEARARVEAEIQAITFNEFLPLLFGDTIPPYSGYNASINPQIKNTFSTTAYRFGHSLLSSTLKRKNENGEESASGDLSLAQAFFRPDILSAEGVGPILRGMAVGKSEALDRFIVSDVRNFLFGPPGSGGFDLAALDIQRVRDHGLPDYNTARELMGLDKINSFAELTSDPILQNMLASLYGDVDDMDIFVAGLIEEPSSSLQLGELFHIMILEQFLRLRDGDRFWYEGRFSEEEVAKINETTLADIITRNSDISHLQTHVLIAYNRIGGTHKADLIEGTAERDLLIGFNGADELNGLEGDDELFGDNGPDVLIGGKGNDILHGGSGSDRYVFLPDDGQDKIVHWKAGEIIDLTAVGSTDSVSQVGSDTVINYDGDDEILVKDASVDSVSAAILLN